MKRPANLLLLGMILLSFPVGCDATGDYRIGGQILLRDATPVEGVEVNLDWVGYSEMQFSVFTDEAGWYSSKYDPWFIKDRIIIAPFDPAFLFSPSHYDFPKGLGGDQLGLDFTAIPIE